MNLRCQFLLSFRRASNFFEGGLRDFLSPSHPILQRQWTTCEQTLRHFSVSLNVHHLKMGKKGKMTKKRSADKANGQKNDKTSTSKVPSFINLVIIGTGGPGTSQCLLLATEHSRYMFNCGEGAQRLILMDKRLRRSAFAKLTGVDNVFATQKSWEALGGILGLAMTKYHMHPEATDAGTKLAANADLPSPEIPPLGLYGPEGVEKITVMTRQFADRAHTNIVRKTGEFEDSAMTISPLIFHKRFSGITEEDTQERPTSPKRRKTEFNNSDENVGSSEEFYSESPSEREVYGYICKVKPPTPKINVEKCVDAGITIGPMVGELQRGFSVTLKDGTVVHPSQVTDTPPTLNRAFLVIDCPSEDYFPSLEANAVLQKYRSQTNEDSSFGLIVHMTTADVLNTSYYRTWMEGFGTDTDHLIMNEDAGSTDAPRIRSYQAHLNVVDAEVFPMMPAVIDGAIPDLPSSSSMAPTSKALELQGRSLKNVRMASFGLIYTIRGKEVGFQMEPDDFDLTALHEQIEIPSVKVELESLRQIKPSTSSESSDSEAEFPQVIFLGTGSSQPSTYRAQSFILAHIDGDSSVILDCGEESYGQLVRFYGPSESKNILRKVKAVFISHLHGDHHMGLVTLLREREKAFNDLNIPFEPTVLLAPIQLRRWLRFYQSEMGQISHLFRCLHHQKSLKITDGDSSISVITEDQVLKEVGLKKYDLAEVIHSRGAYGCAMTLSNGFKLVYSGDTRPCPQLAEIGASCDLLIHEATHDDTLLHLAKGSNHSTFSEAIDMGNQMKAKQIILTHFSQRYTHMIPLLDALPSNVGIAFDNMKVTPKNMSYLSKFIPALTLIFDDKIKKNVKNIKARNYNS